MNKKVNQTLEYRSILCDSYEEVYALMWLWELKDNGYISNITRSESFDLSKPVCETYTKLIQLKTKTKEVQKTKTILREHIYTPEFKVTLNKDIGLYHLDNICYIEVKPKFDFQNMVRLFKINQKWMYAKYGILVNLITPETLFEKTFTPKEYLKTATGKSRKIKWKIKTLEEWINTIS